MSTTTTALPTRRTESDQTYSRPVAETPAKLREKRDDLVVALAWAALIGVALVVNTRTVATWPDAGLGAAPFDGQWDWRPDTSFLPVIALGAASALWGPQLARSLRWNLLVPVSAAATTAWTVALAATDGWEAVAHPLTSRHEYLPVVGKIDDPLNFLSNYTERIASYPVHLQGHPPGATLSFWSFDRLGFVGVEWAAALVVACAGVATAATLVTFRSVAGELAARHAAPFVAIAPAALWMGTSVDALFTAVGALGIALMVAGRRPASFVAGGLVLGLALHLTYGAVPLLLIPLLVALWRRDVRPLLWASLGALAVTAVFVAGGFWWFDGLHATREMYKIGISQHRPYRWLVFVANPAVLALATGPAVVAGYWLLRRRRPPMALVVLPAAALVAVLIANLSGFSKGEVERIWLPFMPWLLTATAALPVVRQRMWLGAQVSVAILLQAALRSPW